MKRAGLIVPLLMGLGAAILLLPLLRSPLVRGIELKTLDARMRWRGEASAAGEIAVIAIDARSVDALGQWPWPRSTMADIVNRLAGAGAKAIAFDVLFSEPERGGGGGDEALAAAIRQAKGVVLGYYFRPAAETAPPRSEAGGSSRDAARSAVPSGDASNIETSRIELAVTPPAGFPEVPDLPGVETNLDVLAGATPHAGHFVIRPDVDGTARRYSLVLRHDGQFYPALALRAASVFLDLPISLRPYRGQLPMVRLGEREVPASEKGELLVNFRGACGRTFPYFSAVDVLDDRVPADALRGRLVFIGATETGIGDLRTTPFDLAAPGVEIHATVADNLIHARFVRSTAAQTIEGILGMFLLGPLAGLAAARIRRPSVGTGAAAAVILVWIGLAQLAFARGNAHLPLVLPVATGLAAATASVVYRTVFTEKRAREIRRTFQQFVSAAVVEEMLKDPDRVRLGGERRELTVLFSDIRGFTSLSEKLPPERIVSILNEYLTPMTRVIIEAGGTLDKYMGDAIMAFFGAPVAQPDHAARAAAAAIGMRARLAGLNEAWSAQGLPTIAAGIGLNTGVMSVGNMGSEMIFDYTVIGDAANLGSRLEGLNKVYGTDILVSEFTAAALPGEFVLRELDRVRVKGKEDPVTILELVGRRGEIAAWWTAGVAERIGSIAPTGIADDAAREFLENWAEAMNHFRKREFERACALLDRCLAARPNDGPTRLYLDRCHALAAAPPPSEWDGVVTMETK